MYSVVHLIHSYNNYNVSTILSALMTKTKILTNMNVVPICWWTLSKPTYVGLNFADSHVGLCQEKQSDEAALRTGSKSASPMYNNNKIPIWVLLMRFSNTELYKFTVTIHHQPKGRGSQWWNGHSVWEYTEQYATLHSPHKHRTSIDHLCDLNGLQQVIQGIRIQNVTCEK